MSTTEGIIRIPRWITSLASFSYSDLFASGSFNHISAVFGDTDLVKLQALGMVPFDYGRWTAPFDRFMRFTISQHKASSTRFNLCIRHRAAW
jgi:hypothetical protein